MLALRGRVVLHGRGVKEVQQKVNVGELIRLILGGFTMKMIFRPSKLYNFTGQPWGYTRSRSWGECCFSHGMSNMLAWAGVRDIERKCGCWSWNYVNSFGWVGTDEFADGAEGPIGFFP